MPKIRKVRYKGTDYDLDPDHSAFYYTPGEVGTITKYMAAGHITSSGYNLYFTFVMPKSLINCSGFTVNSLKLNIRGQAGYIEQSASVTGGYEYANNANFTIQKNAVNGNAITLCVVKKSDVWNYTDNNRHCTVCIDSVKLTFN